MNRGPVEPVCEDAARLVKETLGEAKGVTKGDWRDNARQYVI